MFTLVVYGFLGSGKTTFVNHLLQRVFPEMHCVVIENESGAESVDGEFLKAQQCRVVDLRAGCVCCTLRSELSDVARRIATETALDLLVLEPSGIAALEDLFSIPNFPIGGVVTLVDVTRYDLLMHINRDFYQRQFRLSPVLFLTKCELVEESRLLRIREELSAMAPLSYVSDDYRMLGTDDFLHLLGHHCASFRTFVANIGGDRVPQFSCNTFRLTAQNLSRERFEDVWNRCLDLCPDLVRMKAVMKMDGRHFKADYTGGKVLYTLMGHAPSSYSLSLWRLRRDGEDESAISQVEQCIKLLCNGSDL